MKNIKLKQIILGSFLVSNCLILFSIKQCLPQLKMPIIGVSLFPFWFLPLILIIFLFPLKISFCFLFLYCLLQVVLFDFSSYLGVYNLIPNNFNKNQVIFFMILTGSIIPIMSFFLISLFYHKNKNILFIFFIFFIISLFQSLSKTFNGYYIYFNVIQDIIKNKFKALTTFFYFSPFSFIFLLNLIPILISDLLLFFIFLFSKKIIIQLSEFFQ
ncbi:hypothetical protein [Candidatus Phytoplasma pini]|uniref:Uncharacterized protein n=1 Tax=Candidatus Phytoplasma pini TaxID=267362 RepID=A0A559KIZ2_9MOLU|nr:hypothetical protein [Candidatus Phytoplasma pini]TVY12104.1 hypothetical protein MDPP_00353 [Candidatus Phytoplasma pini]